MKRAIAVPLGIHLAVGVSGSGKTYGTRRAVYQAALAMPVLVLDINGEWKSAPPQFGAVGAANVDDAITKLESHRLVVVRDIDDEAAAFERACEWACEGGVPRGIAASEAHLALPSMKPLGKNAKRAIMQWRHHRVALFLDTPRLAELHASPREQAFDLRLYSIVGPRDIAVVRELWGRECVDAVSECAARFARGEPGWHVQLGLVRRPPFALSRDP